MATQAQLEHDRMRVEVARMVEEALECPEGILSYFDNIPPDDEQPDGNPDPWGELSWKSGFEADDDDEEDAVYRVAASAVFGLAAGQTAAEGFKTVVMAVAEVATNFEAARYKLQEKEAALD